MGFIDRFEVAFVFVALLCCFLFLSELK